MNQHISCFGAIMYPSQIHPLFRTSRAPALVQVAVDLCPGPQQYILKDFPAALLAPRQSVLHTEWSFKSINQAMSLPMTNSCKDKNTNSSPIRP